MPCKIVEKRRTGKKAIIVENELMSHIFIYELIRDKIILQDLIQFIQI